MQLWVLGSGSRGNAIVIDAGDTRILVDAGFPPRTLALRMRACRIPPESVRAAIITHEHSDHVRGAAKAAARWGWELHASAGTIRSCASLRRAHAFHAGQQLRIGCVSVQTVRVSHDATEPIALVALDERTGVRAGIAHDLGCPNETLRRALARVDVLLLESNHDEGMLRTGPYPPFLQARIAGARGHLSNGAAGALTRALAHRALRDVVLMHLSEENNTPRVAHDTMAAAMRGTAFRGRLTPSRQQAPSGPFGPPAPPPRTRQLALGL
ncbi:MAG TPA: MBL fold metallo-hydrolase [Gemmatimonadaceae bacterium]|nr:MBL fold metallo-hydrolase [Gemmatimonadaceae bacterium]